MGSREERWGEKRSSKGRRRGGRDCMGRILSVQKLFARGIEPFWVLRGTCNRSKRFHFAHHLCYTVDMILRNERLCF